MFRHCARCVCPKYQAFIVTTGPSEQRPMDLVAGVI
jgi:hypothetical protein